MAQNGSLVATANGHLTNGHITTLATPNVPKKIIICCDGTWVDRDNRPGVPTNVSRLASAILTEDEKQYQQIVYYQAGVGTGFGPINFLVGGGLGLGLKEHIREAYSFLANNYSEVKPNLISDSIFLIGFSRGAFTARSIGGLLGAIGLLKKKAMPFFFDIFDDWQNAGRKEPTFFESYFTDPEERAKYEPPKGLALKSSPKDIDLYMDAYRKSLLLCGLTQEVKIKCIGVFDTVGSLGVPIHPLVQRISPIFPAFFRRYGWFDTRIGNHVDNGFHALALDEKRSPFHPTLWERTDEDTSFIKQVWFPGSHGNIGGGYNDTGIADITLTWMMDHLSGDKLSENFRHEDWIQFDENYIRQRYDKRRAQHKRERENHTANQSWPEWALGTINDTFTFPFTLAGKTVRTPGRFLFTNHVTGREVRGKPLTRTNELIHPSVRVRIHKGGLAPEPHWAPFPFSIPTLIKQAYYSVRGRLTDGRWWPLYQPTRRRQPLQDWELRDGHRDHNELHFDAEVELPKDSDVYWDYIGTKPGPPDKLCEDKLKTIQKKLLEMDAHPDQVSVAKQGWVDAITTRARRGFQRPSTF